ncbi:cytochrome c/FTR1 family iron permease [Phenylobacterium sp. 58.2.17]|jgi:high-affinity iron transporter|uniref:cytochrome c/FTR1 family iron permease n=1 Tax=Phenylobacterium sp. 58.2.17 TaxID=2969306 RepID=UPI00086CDA3A|nr:cytochrome c/FTR1 family iron permease [Phenylobacterium sp. 58.2.17]MCX7586292.1 cytochrome c/FTR1 family iron permease [Phenylobacterium sp. 58.2.17]ODT58738.1 MAG: iron permease [Phenylobacterium sp. SCN 69-14]
MRILSILLSAAVAALTLLASPVMAQESSSAQTAWRLLDYVAVDYAGAVDNGQVVSAAEYAEMVEFAAAVRTRLAALPATPAQPQLVRDAAALEAAVLAKAPPAQVSHDAHNLASALLAAYPTPLAPRSAPDLSRGASLYAEQCAACHGPTGGGDGPNAEGLDPPPIAFSDMARAQQRSVFGLYQVIGQGLDGTAMASYAHLSEADRWALAFYVGGLAYNDAQAKAGEQFWRRDAAVRARFSTLAALTQATPQALAADFGPEKAQALTAYLRKTPSALSGQGPNLSLARGRLAQSAAAYAAGDRRRATDLALSAYLDGFEPVEPLLKARDPALMGRIETAMGAYRSAIAAGQPAATVQGQAEQLAAYMDAAERALAPEKASQVSAFMGAFTILLREGLEALLVVVAMVAFLRKAGRSDVLPYVHGGWSAALGAGVLTWAAATYLISISGASRELMEGFGSLIAAVVLVSVGIWMHGKSRADVWQRYIRDKLSKALSRKSAWFLFALAFLVVYREVFETILFFAALWSQGGHMAMLAGAGLGAVVLAAVGWGLLRYSRKLPITQFFALSSVLIAILAVVLAGKGVAGLQEAGLLGIRPIAGLPRIEILGVYPTWQGVAAQIATLLVMVFGFVRNSRTAPIRA